MRAPLHACAWEGDFVPHRLVTRRAESESSSSLPRADARAAPKPASDEARVRSAGPVSRFGAMLERGGQAVKQLKHSVTSTDHPLSRSGLMQASALQANIAAAMRCIGGGVRHSRQSRKEMTDAELEEHEAVAMQSLADADVPDGTKLASVLSTMLHAQTLWASPLARATQTAMLVLQPFATENSLNENEALPIELKRNARERRELTSLTTSIGNRCASPDTSFFLVVGGGGRGIGARSSALDWKRSRYTSNAPLQLW